MKRVMIACKTVTQYRVPFLQRLAVALAANGIELTVCYGQPVGADATKRETVPLPGGVFRGNVALQVGGKSLIWQRIDNKQLDTDLIIVEQASKLLFNYRVLWRQLRGGAPVAFWGHGANLREHDASPVGEAVKRRVSRLPHWWFAYTEGCRDRVRRLGYPAERITVVQNTIDTVSLQSGLSALTESEVSGFAREHELTEGRTGLYIGGLYEEKRLAFVLDAAEEIGRRLPGFRMLIGGDGPLREQVRRAADKSRVIDYLGRIDGARRLLALRTADVTLMPGLVGLAVVDAFVGQAPVVTTALPYHAPEFEYMRPDENGIVLSASTTPAGYADVVVTTLDQPDRLATLRSGCAEAAERYGIEQMVRRFAGGVDAAVESGTRAARQPAGGR
jgi:glycosyltransferase involved in cell wall biosynthesis